MSQPHAYNGAIQHNGTAMLKALYNRREFRLLLYLAAIVLCMHLVLGTHPLVVIMVVMTIVIGLYPVANYGFLNIGSLLILLVAFRYVGFPLVVKLIYLQPLDSNLDQPLASFTVVLLGVLSYRYAFGLVNKMGFRQTILRPVTNLHQLQWISIISFIIGCTANFGVAFHVGTEYTGITVGNFFVLFLHLALIAAIAAEMSKSSGQRSWNLWVLLIIFAEVAFALVRNSRMGLVEIVLCYVFTITAFDGKIRWRRTSFAGLLVILLLLVITPIMLHVRSVRSHLSWTQMITATISAASDWQKALDYYEGMQLLLKREGFHLNYYGSPHNILERVSHINHVDVVKTAVDNHSPTGLLDLRFGIARALPRFIAPEKPVGYSLGGWLYCETNVECIEESYATVPLIANGYAAFGWWGTVFYPLIFGAAILLLIQLISGLNLRYNIWGVYFLLRFHNSFIEGDSAMYLQSIIRDIPQDLIVLSAIIFISRIASSKGGYQFSSK